jgi:hypothetical protein
MAITLTSDPIISAADLATLFGWTATAEETYHAINAASKAFLTFTRRDRITSGAVTAEIHRLPPLGCPKLWLRAAPVNTGQTFTATVYDEGVSDDTLTTSDYILYATTGEVRLLGYSSIGLNDTRDIRFSYTGGFTTVPYDVVEAAVELMKLHKQRREGMAGVTSASREGFSTNYQVKAIPDDIAQAWQPYRIY